ncbi:MAG: hypothetical protein LBU68_02690, partial [Rickettsiales bacterium]|nr:hypothetical protein [Rickettsiales bacterium]
MRKRKGIITINTDASFNAGFAGAAIIANTVNTRDGAETTRKVKRKVGFHCPDNQIAELTAVAIALNEYLRTGSDIIINTDCNFCLYVFNRIVQNIETICSAIESGKKLPIKPIQKNIGEKNAILRGLYGHIFSLLVLQEN